MSAHLHKSVWVCNTKIMQKLNGMKSTLTWQLPVKTINSIPIQPVLKRGNKTIKTNYKNILSNCFEVLKVWCDYRHVKMEDSSEIMLKSLCCTCLSNDRKLFQLCRVNDGVNNLYSLLSHDSEAYRVRYSIIHWFIIAIRQFGS